MAVLPTEPIYSKLLITSLKPEYMPVKHNLASIVSMLQVENIFYNPSSEPDNKILKKRQKLMSPQSDHLTLLKILNTFKSTLRKQGKTAARQFCRDFYLNEKSLAKALQI